MARCRIGYLLALAAAAAFLVCFNGWLGPYLLALALVFPLLSLLVSLPGMLGCGARLSLPENTVRRGGGGAAELHLANRWRFSAGRATAVLRCTNLMTGESRTVRRKLPCPALGFIQAEELDATHCGVVRCQVLKLRCCDLLGLFSLHRPLPPPVELAVLPLDLPPEEVPLLLGAADRNAPLRPRPGGGPGEDYDLRPYRPGDPLRSVHWKLSSKVDGLVVRETLEPRKTAVVLSYNHFGKPEELDRALDRLDAVSRALIGHERGHYIQWTDPSTGEGRVRAISTLRDLRDCQWEMLSTPAPRSGRPGTQAAPIPGVDGPIRRLHISAANGEEATP